MKIVLFVQAKIHYKIQGFLSFWDCFGTLLGSVLECVFCNSEEFLSHIFWLKGNLHFPMGNIDKCMNAHEQALKYGRETGSSEAQARAFGGLADAHYLDGRMLSAGDAFERCVDLAKKDSLTRIICANQNMAALGKYYALEFDAGIAMLDESIDLCVATNNYRAQILCHLHYGDIYSEMAQFDKALEDTQTACDMSKAYGIVVMETIALGRKSRILFYMNLVAYQHMVVFIHIN